MIDNSDGRKASKLLYKRQVEKKEILFLLRHFDIMNTFLLHFSLFLSLEERH